MLRPRTRKQKKPEEQHTAHTDAVIPEGGYGPCQWLQCDFPDTETDVLCEEKGCGAAFHAYHRQGDKTPLCPLHFSSSRGRRKIGGGQPPSKRAQTLMAIEKRQAVAEQLKRDKDADAQKVQRSLQV